MKQTNNAIKFLMAQYRAIFKNANIAMAVALATAALAASQAQAAPNDTTLDLGTSAQSPVESDIINSEVTVSGNAGGFINDLTIAKGGTLTWDGSTTPNKGHIYVKNSLNVEEGGNLVLKGSSSSLFGVVGTHNDPSFDADSALNLKGGSITIDKSQIQMRNINLNAGSVTIGGNVGDNSGSDFADNALINAESSGGSGGTFSLAGAEVTMNAGSALVAKDFQLTSGTIKMQGTATDDKAAVIRAYNETSSGAVTVNGASIEATGAGNVIGGNKIHLTTGTMTIADKGVVTLAGELKKDGNLAAAISGGKVALTMKDFTVDGKGKLVIGHTTSGGTVTVTGKSSITSDIENNAAITVSGANAELAVNSSELTSNEGLFKSASGSLTLSGGALRIADATSAEKSFDVAGLDFSGSAAQNKIYVSGAGVIAGDFLTVSKAVTSGSKLTVKATNLTLGKADTKLTDAIGVAGLEAEHVTFVNSGSDFNLLDTLTLATAGDSTIKGGVKVGSDQANGALKINGGNYTIEAGKNFETTASGAVTLNNASKLDASGVANLKLASGNNSNATVKVSGGSTLVLDQADVYSVSGDTITLTNADSKVVKNAISTDATSILEFKLADGTKYTKTQVENIKKALSTSGLNGMISFGENFVLDGLSGDTAIGDVIEGADVYGGKGVTTTDGDINKNVIVGNIKVTSDTANAAISDNKSAILYKADANGNFVSNNKGAADVSLGSGSELVLAGKGNIGAIEGTNANSGAVTIGHSKQASTNVVAESVGNTNGVLSLDLVGGSSLTLTAADAKLQTKELNLSEGSNLSAVAQDITVASSGGSGSDILGSITAKSLTFTDSGTATEYVIAGDNTKVDVDALNLGSSGSLFVGVNNNNGSLTATLEVGTLSLGGGNLIVDPAMTDKAAIAAVKTFKNKDTNGDAIVDGKIAVGMNSAVGIGFDSRDEVEQYLTNAGLMVDSKFINETNKPHGALVLNESITIASGNGVVIDTTKTDTQLQNALTSATNKFQMSGNAALILNDSVFERDADGKLIGTAVTLANGSGGAVSADANSKVILAGDFDANIQGLKIFASNNDQFSVSGSGIKVVSANGALSTTIGADGSLGAVIVKYDVFKDKFLKVASPVRDLLIEAATNVNGVVDKSQLGGQFLGEVANNPHDFTGVAADAAAHAATYAGAQQAAVASVSTMATAMVGRVGTLGVESSAISATGTQANGGVWVAPMYSSLDSDGFDAQGGTYGADVDLAGVAFGADTVNGNMRFGAVFNIGSGDADGKGNGSGLKDEFDYYGFGIYSAMGFGNFALVGDASLTVISHDVEGFGLNGEADTSAVTMGLTGQYTFATPMIDVTPHLGARFIRLDTDSYDLNSDKGVLATTDFEVQNVFSVPLGVTLSKAFTAGGWALAPSADLTLTFNTGDTDAESTTTFTGAPAIGLTTEVLDEVQYGLTLGLGANYGAFGTSFGVNYTGSSNTDSFGVNAQARYVF